MVVVWHPGTCDPVWVSYVKYTNNLTICPQISYRITEVYKSGESSYEKKTHCG